MRTPHNRWTVLAGAAAVSLAAFGVPALAAADGDAAPAPQTARQESTYLVDGYRIGYLPPGLDDYGSASTTSTDGEGNRTSSLAWLRGETVYGEVGVRRRASAFTLGEIRDRYYGHLDPGTLRGVTVNGDPGYLSETSGEVFWADGEGAALSVFLEPGHWSSTELMRTAEGITPDTGSGASFSVTQEADRSPLDLEWSEEGRRLPLMASSTDPGSEQHGEEHSRTPSAPRDGATGEPPQERGNEVVRCLTEKFDEEIPTEVGFTTSWGGANWSSGLWDLVPLPTREAAVAECARRTGLTRTQVQEVADSLDSGRSPSGEDSGHRGSESVGSSEDGERQSPWSLLPWN